MEYLPLLMLAPLSRLIVSDFRTREVSVMWLGILAIGTVCIPLIQDGWADVLKRSGHNFMLLLYMSAGIVLWSWIKEKRVVNPVNMYIGLGDLLFFLALVPLFTVKEYAYILVCSMLFSLVWQLVPNFFNNNKAISRNIPLIATSGIVVGGAIIFEVFFGDYT